MNNNTQTLVLLVIFVPIIGSLTAPLAGLISRKARALWSVLLGVATSLFSLLLIPAAAAGKAVVFRFRLWDQFDFILQADGLSIFVAAVASFIGALIVVYSVGYIAQEENQSEYYLMVLLFIGAMMGLVFSANLVFLYLFWEIAAIACWRLIGFYREKDHVRKADKAFLVTFGGAVFMLLGFIMIYNKTGTFDLTAESMKGFVVPGSAVLLILLGMFSKSATVPLHTWLPDAGVAPSTVTALLHAAVLVKIGVYAFARLFCFTFALPPGWQQAIPILAMVSSLVAAAAATVENDLKRILAYSTVSQIGYIFLGFAVLTPAGVTGSTLFILMHGLAKAGLFLCAGIVIHGLHKRDIREMGGLLRTMPLTAIAFLACAFSVIGLPPFGGFFSKLLVIAGTVKAGHVWVAALALFIAVLTMYYLMRVFALVFLGEAKTHGHREGTRSMVYVVVALAVLSLLAGIFVSYPMKLVDTSVNKEMAISVRW